MESIHIFSLVTELIKCDMNREFLIKGCSQIPAQLGLLKDSFIMRNYSSQWKLSFFVPMTGIKPTFINYDLMKYKIAPGAV